MKSNPSRLSGLLVLALIGPFAVACSATPVPTRVQLLQPLLPTPSASSTVPATPNDAAPTVHLASPEPLSATVSFATTPAPSLTPPVEVLPPSPGLRQLTSGGCCTAPFWSADSRQVQFIDRPASRPVGIYGVNVERPSPPSLVTEWIVNTSGGGDFYVYPDGDTTVVQQAATGEKYDIANGGRPVSISPSGQWLLWQVMEQQGDFDRRRSQIWVADVDGGNARVVAETMGYSWSEWVDGQRILLVGLPLEDSPLVAIATLTLGAGAGEDRYLELVQVSRPRETLVSPAGNWLVYLLSFQDDAQNDGLWIVPTDGSQGPRKLGFFGSYRWRDDAHLLYVPLEPGVESHALWEYDAVSGQSRRLTDPAQTSFKIANNDWAISPDGRYVVFVNAADHNLWLLDLQSHSG